MPRDKRLYMTFPIDFHRHPKVSRLPIDVRWAFVEMNGEARIADNDGVFAAADAEFAWGKPVLDALVASHPTRPLVQHVGDTYVIRDYAEHQQTRAEREDLRAKRSAAGRKGGLSRGQASANQVPSRAQQTQAESESESEDYYSPSKSQSLDNRASDSTDAEDVPEMTRRLASQKGITSLGAVVEAIHRHTSARVNPSQALQVALWILDKAPAWPDAPQRYVTGSIAKSPAEVEQHIFEAVA